jgi:hypothetical protein
LGSVFQNYAINKLPNSWKWQLLMVSRANSMSSPGPA